MGDRVRRSDRHADRGHAEQRHADQRGGRGQGVSLGRRVGTLPVSRPADVHPGAETQRRLELDGAFSRSRAGGEEQPPADQTEQGTPAAKASQRAGRAEFRARLRVGRHATLLAARDHRGDEALPDRRRGPQPGPLVVETPGSRQAAGPAGLRGSVVGVLEHLGSPPQASGPVVEPCPMLHRLRRPACDPRRLTKENRTDQRAVRQYLQRKVG